MTQLKPYRKETVLVRCLGPGAEHLFKSADRFTERICPQCRKKMASVGSALRDEPVKVNYKE